MEFARFAFGDQAKARAKVQEDVGQLRYDQVAVLQHRRREVRGVRARGFGEHAHDFFGAPPGDVAHIVVVGTGLYIECIYSAVAIGSGLLASYLFESESDGFAAAGQRAPILK